MKGSTRKRFNLGTTGRLVLIALLLADVTGCGGRKQVTELQRKEARHLVAEADFARNLRDWPRAEGLLAKATSLAPDDGGYWTALGSVRMRLGDKAGAKNAYREALKAHEAAARIESNDPEHVLKQVYVLALLGQLGDARALLDKMARQFPADRSVRSFIETKQLDQLIAEPEFKQVAL